MNIFLNELDLTKLSDLLTYNPKAPLLFSSGLFLFLFTAFSMLYYLFKNNRGIRIVYVTLFSLFFYYKSSGIYFLLLIFTATSDFIIGHYLVRCKKQSSRKWLVFLSLAVNLGMLGYFKYTNFLADVFSGIFRVPFDIERIFLPVGISFFTFQSISYIIDIYRNEIKPLDRWIDYLFYISFFPQLVAGPIVRAKDFIPQIHKPVHVTDYMFGKGVFLIISGLFKKAVISDYISLNFVDRVFDQPVLYSGLENLIAVYGYALQIYCDFSGYSDMAIGIALLLGFKFNVNFNSPYKSATITEFWRRWHISLSSWLKDYLYISLGGNRKGRVRTYFNLITTMLLGGLWHGASWQFVFWGALHGSSLAIHKWVMEHFKSFKAMGQEMTPFRRFIGIVFTFHLVCFGWIFFRASSFSNGWEVIHQIFTNFHPELIGQFVTGYSAVCFFILLGYILHFTPESWERKAYQWMTDCPLIIKALACTLIIVLVMQLKSSDVQPFIYFQF
ncbi:MAG: MBOAT family O-acyltransferase [Bacteroidales bacterium]